MTTEETTTIATEPLGDWRRDLTCGVPRSDLGVARGS